MEIGAEDLRIFVDASVLNHRAAALIQAHMEPKFVGQKVELGAKGEALHVFIEVIEVWILGKGLVNRLKVVSLLQKLNERGLSSPHISRDCDKFFQRSSRPVFPYASTTVAAIASSGGEVLKTLAFPLRVAFASSA